MAITIAYDLKAGKMELKNTTLDKIAKYFDSEHIEFSKKAILVHRRSVFEILTYLIKLCPVDTGRLRASWTPYLDRYGQSKRYSRIMDRPPISGPTRKSERKGLDQKAIAEGKGLGVMIDEALATTVGTNVNYAQDAETRSGFILRTLTWGARRYELNFKNFFAAAIKQGMIPPDDDQSVDINREVPTE